MAKKTVSKEEAIKMRKDARRDYVRANRMLSGGQAKLDKNKNNRIDAQDFKILRAEKAKGRGQGLQDEKMKPGKPMKAALGVIALGRGAKKMKEKGKMMPFGFGAAGAIAKKKKEILGKKVGGELKKDPTKPINPADRGMKKRMAERAMRAAKATKVGKIAAGVAGVGLAAKAYLNKKLEESRAKKKAKGKMGGGMMKRPMGYSKGMSSKDDNLRDIRKTESMIGASKSSKREQAIKNRMSTGAQGSRKNQGSRKKMAITIGGKIIPAERVGEKMGGGMMQRPGYNVGGSVTVKTKLGRNRPTKMY